MGRGVREDRSKEEIKPSAVQREGGGKGRAVPAAPQTEKIDFRRYFVAVTHNIVSEVIKD